ncbi:MAG TPA: hypothetical protein VGR06_33070 [Actinophytocola sp.]|jgi:endogenous inhibitor of DNA gyrase (YacG/DUF329 family)|uniref:hypothetical protein n=1 Tax=Actinophytocola sp. TaxID=1872138 RepID=UPI002DFFFA0B|nr:hypothetical protein [Actinophytocola sp.]
MSPEPATRACPVCQTPLPTGVRRRYCSPACKTAGWRRNNPSRPPGPPRTREQAPAPDTGAQPAAIRDCPHCGKQITIVALLTTPQIAGPQLANGTPDVIPLRPARTL